MGNEENVFRRHQIAIARKTLKMSCVGARIMGGMDHRGAAIILYGGYHDGMEFCSCFGEKDITAHEA